MFIDEQIGLDITTNEYIAKSMAVKRMIQKAHFLSG